MRTYANMRRFGSKSLLTNIPRPVSGLGAHEVLCWEFSVGMPRAPGSATEPMGTIASDNPVNGCRGSKMRNAMHEGRRSPVGGRQIEDPWTGWRASWGGSGARGRPRRGARRVRGP